MKVRLKQVTDYNNDELVTKISTVLDCSMSKRKVNILIIQWLLIELYQKYHKTPGKGPLAKERDFPMIYQQDQYNYKSLILCKKQLIHLYIMCLFQIRLGL